MAATPAPTASEMLTAREAWIAKGRPADPSDAYWASVLTSEATPRPSFVAPLVSLV